MVLIRTVGNGCGKIEKEWMAGMLFDEFEAGLGDPIEIVNRQFRQSDKIGVVVVNATGKVESRIQNCGFRFPVIFFLFFL